MKRNKKLKLLRWKPWKRSSKKRLRNRSRRKKSKERDSKKNKRLKLLRWRLWKSNLKKTCRCKSKTKRLNRSKNTKQRIGRRNRISKKREGSQHLND